MLAGVSRAHGNGMARLIYILNGPNLNLLGTREPGIYGSAGLGDIEARCAARATALDFAIVFRQTNHEGELVDWIQEAGRKAAGIVINAAAYTHSSIAVHDALKAAALPVVEVHLSNIFAREPFRHESFVSPVADGVICGLGPIGYELALEALSEIIARGSHD